MPKVAKLVSVTLTTRVIVDSEADDDQIMKVALPSLKETLNLDSMENIEDIVDDKECPYGSLPEDNKQ